MSRYQNQYNLQSYFKSLCNSLYIAYDQTVGLEIQKEILIDNYQNGTIQIINSLLNSESVEHIKNKFIKGEESCEEIIEEISRLSKYSYEELIKERERLLKYRKNIEELETISIYWRQKMKENDIQIQDIIKEIQNNKFSIILTTRQEVFGIIRFYLFNNIKDYPVINIEDSISTQEEIYNDFMLIYKQALQNDNVLEDMILLYNKYF